MAEIYLLFVENLPIARYKVNGAARESAQGHCLRLPAQSGRFYLIFLPSLLYAKISMFVLRLALLLRGQHLVLSSN